MQEDLVTYMSGDDHILRADDISTPTGIEQFFETAIRGRKFPAAIHDHQNIEPTSEPCTEEIPWEDLVYWLGNSATGEVDCACATCQYERSQGRVPVALLGHNPEQDNQARDHYIYIPSTFYKRLSAMIPVIRLPRIEGIN